MNQGKILLTSTGLTPDNIYLKFKTLVSDPGNIAVVIITTAADGKSENKYSQLAKKQFQELGFVKIDFVDFETDPQKNLSPYGIIYVCGGNTFKLLTFAKEAGFKSSIENLLKRDGIYIGVSAGSIILGPSIAVVEEVIPEKNEIELKDLTGFGITNLVILPHYSPEIETKAVAFESKHSVSLERLSNSQAVLIENTKRTLIE